MQLEKGIIFVDVKRLIFPTLPFILMLKINMGVFSLLEVMLKGKFRRMKTKI